MQCSNLSTTGAAFSGHYCHYCPYFTLNHCDPKMSHNERLAQENGIQHSTSYQHLPVEVSLPNPGSGSASPRESTNHSSNSANFVDLRGLEKKIDSFRARHQIQTAPQHMFIRIWWSELLSCVLFIGALVAIVLTVLPYTDEPLPQWRYGLSINTLVAIYAVILKAAVMFVVAEGISQLKWAWYYQHRPLKDLLTFDDASRGPWGALVLIWRLRGRHFISCCGAFISVAALIVDPFAQQIISTYDCSIPIDSELATIPRTNVFDERQSDSDEPTTSLEMQKAINSAIYNHDRSIAFSCPTGNCTFSSEYHTVAYCSECNDTTDKLIIDEVPPHPDLIEETPEYILSQDFADTPSYNKISVTSLSGTFTDSFLILSDFKGYTDLVAIHLSANQNSSCADKYASFEEQIGKGRKTKNKHIKWGCFGVTEDIDSGSITDGMGAAVCTLYPCIKTYTAKIQNGLFSETLLSVAKSWGDKLNPTGLLAMVNVNCLNANDRKSLIDKGYEIEGKMWLPYTPVIYDYYKQADDFVPRNDTISHECIYEYSWLTTEALESFLQSFLNGTIDTSLGEYYGPTQVQTLYNEGHLTFGRVEEIWRNLSDSISTYVRQHGRKNVSAPAVGVVLRSETCVRLQWVFLIYPAVLVFLCIVFFASMILKTQGTKSSRHDWKSSPLALLFHGLDGEVIINRNEAAESVRAKEMEIVAERTSVRLSKTEKGWNFTRE